MLVVENMRVLFGGNMIYDVFVVYSLWSLIFEGVN